MHKKIKSKKYLRTRINVQGLLVVTHVLFIYPYGYLRQLRIQINIKKHIFFI